MCLCNEQANKICFLVQAVHNEIDGVLLPKVNTDPDVSACSQQGAKGLGYISKVDSLNHLVVFWMSNWYLEVKAVQPATAQGNLNQLRCGKCSKIFYIKLIFSVFFLFSEMCVHLDGLCHLASTSELWSAVVIYCHALNKTCR